MKIDDKFAEKIMASALKSGADEAEIYIIKSNNLTVEVKKGETESLEKSFDAGYSVRVIRDSREGFSYSTDPEDFMNCIERAVETSRWPEEDKYTEFPADNTQNEVDVFDPAVDALTEEKVIEMALDVEKSAVDADSRITRTRKTSVSISSGRWTIMNSRGTSKSFKSTFITSHTMVIAEDGQDNQAGWDYQGSRFLEDISFCDIGRTAAQRAVRLLGARKTGSSKGNIILDNSVASEFLAIFASALSAEAVQKGKSLLAGKIGKPVVSDKVDIVDNALADKLVGSRPFDAEGVAAKNKSLIKKGVLKGYLHNTYTANKDNTSSTGNAVRNGFKSTPSVGITNMFIMPAEGSEPCTPDSLISSVDNGLLVTEAMGIHTANPVSGDFSVGVTGIWISGGRLRHPVREAVISGNISDLFCNIVTCGNDLKFFGKTGSPSLLIKDTDISG